MLHTRNQLESRRGDLRNDSQPRGSPCEARARRGLLEASWGAKESPCRAFPREEEGREREEAKGDDRHRNRIFLSQFSGSFLHLSDVGESSRCRARDSSQLLVQRGILRKLLLQTLAVSTQL